MQCWFCLFLVLFFWVCAFVTLFNKYCVTVLIVCVIKLASVRWPVDAGDSLLCDDAEQRLQCSVATFGGGCRVSITVTKFVEQLILWILHKLVKGRKVSTAAAEEVEECVNFPTLWRVSACVIPRQTRQNIVKYDNILAVLPRGFQLLSIPTLTTAVMTVSMTLTWSVFRRR